MRIYSKNVIPAFIAVVTIASCIVILSNAETAKSSPQVKRKRKSLKRRLGHKMPVVMKVGITLKTSSVISIKFLLVISMFRKQCSQELRVASFKVNLLDI